MKRFTKRTNYFTWGKENKIDFKKTYFFSIKLKIQPRKSAKSNMKNPRNQYEFKMPCSRTHAANRNYVCTACGHEIKDNNPQGTLLCLSSLKAVP